MVGNEEGSSAATRAAGKLSRTGGRHPWKDVLTCLHATQVPPVKRSGDRGQTVVKPAGLLMLSGGLAGQEPLDLGRHRMPCRFGHEGSGCHRRCPPLADRQGRARCPPSGDQPATAPGSVVPVWPPTSREAGVSGDTMLQPAWGLIWYTKPQTSRLFPEGLHGRE
jgi:hypothetical protein